MTSFLSAANGVFTNHNRRKTAGVKPIPAVYDPPSRKFYAARDGNRVLVSWDAMKHAGPDELGIEGQIKLALPVVSLEVVPGCDVVVGTMVDGSQFVTGWCGLEQRLVVQYVNGFGGNDGAGRYPERDEINCGAGVFIDRGDDEAGMATGKKRKMTGGTERVTITLSSVTRVDSSGVFRFVTNRLCLKDRNAKQQKEELFVIVTSFEKELSHIPPSISEVHVTPMGDAAESSSAPLISIIYHHDNEWWAYTTSSSQPTRLTTSTGIDDIKQVGAITNRIVALLTTSTLLFYDVRLQCDVKVVPLSKVREALGGDVTSLMTHVGSGSVVIGSVCEKTGVVRLAMAELDMSEGEEEIHFDLSSALASSLETKAVVSSLDLGGNAGCDRFDGIVDRNLNDLFGKTVDKYKGQENINMLDKLTTLAASEVYNTRVTAGIADILKDFMENKPLTNGYHRNPNHPTQHNYENSPLSTAVPLTLLDYIFDKALEQLVSAPTPHLEAPTADNPSAEYFKTAYPINLAKTLAMILRTRLIAARKNKRDSFIMDFYSGSHSPVKNFLYDALLQHTTDLSESSLVMLLRYTLRTAIPLSSWDNYFNFLANRLTLIISYSHFNDVLLRTNLKTFLLAENRVVFLFVMTLQQVFQRSLSFDGRFKHQQAHEQRTAKVDTRRAVKWISAFLDVYQCVRKPEDKNDESTDATDKAVASLMKSVKQAREQSDVICGLSDLIFYLKTANDGTPLYNKDGYGILDEDLMSKTNDGDSEEGYIVERLQF